jgi:N-acetylneuraminic acid mutarotase/fibronectin type 3 domain-containing protein
MFRRSSTMGHQRARQVINQAVIEALENRQLFHDGHVHLAVNVDFQVNPTPVYPDYVADTGAVYGDRGNGWTYGFSKSVTDTARDRDSGKSPDERYDEFVTLKDRYQWNIALPNDTYDVHLVMGDPITWTGRHYAVNVEGSLAVDFVPTKAERFVESDITVTVTDGKLTLTGASGSRYNNLSFIDIKTHGEDEPPPTALPDDPTELDASGISATQSKLTWLDNADNEDGYRIYRKLDDDGTYQLIDTVDANETEYLDNGLSPDTRYVYKVIAFNELGNSSFSNEDSATTFDSAPTGTTISWDQVAPSPIARAEALGGVVNGKLYVMGGLFSGGHGTILATTRSDVYDPATNTWTRIKDMPEKLTHAGQVIVGDTIWLIGGYVGDHPGPATNHVWKYNTTTNTWSAGPTLPKMRGAGGAGLIGNTIVFFGGMNYNRDWSAPNTWALDLNNQGAGWVSKADMPNPRNHIAAASVGGFVYAIGGQYNQEEAQIAQNEVDRYDLATDTWVKVGELPTVRSHINSSTFAWNGKILIVGGETAYNTVVRNVTLYDPATNTSTEMSPLPFGRSTSVAGVLPDGRLISATGNSPVESTTTWIGTVS